MCGGGGKTERLGQVHGLLGALELDLFVDLTLHLSGQAALLLRVGKDARVVKADGVHKVDKVAELVVGLGREADHGRGTDHDAGDALAKVAEQILELLARTGATHGLEDARVAVLHGDIDIGQHLGRIANRLDEFVSHALGLQIEHADPDVVRAHGLGDGTQQLRQIARRAIGDVLVGKVGTPDARVLADQHDLAHTAGNQVAHLGDDALGIARMIAAADVGNHAEAAEAVAAIGNPDVSNGALDSALDLRNIGSDLTLDTQHAIDDRHDAVLLVGLHKGSDLGQLVRQVVAIARRHTAAHDDGARTNAVLNLVGELERGLDALGRCGGEERACIDDGDIGILRVECLLVARGGQKRTHAVGVNLVLSAPEGDVEHGAQRCIHVGERSFRLILAVVGELQRLAVVLVAQELNHGLQRVLRSRGNTQFVGLDGHLDLELLILDVLVDLLGGRLVDTLDDMAEHAHGAARCRLRSIPRDSLEVDAALDELGAQHVNNLFGDKVGRGVDRKELVALRKLDRGAGILKVIALGNLARGLLEGVVDLLHVDLGHDVEAGIFSHDVSFRVRAA